MKRVAGLALVVGALVSCGGPLAQFIPGQSGFAGNINGTPFVFEPTGTVFAYIDEHTPTPTLVEREADQRVVVVGSYAFFDASGDLNRNSGSDLEELRQEVANNDWIVIQVSGLAANSADSLKGQEKKSVVLRKSADDIYRADMADGSTENFVTHVRFTREALQRNASYDCAGTTTLGPCQPYVPLGGKVTATVTFESMELQKGGSITLRVTLIVEKNGDEGEGTVRTGTLTGRLTASLLEERAAENNMEVLGLYELAGISP